MHDSALRRNLQEQDLPSGAGLEGSRRHVSFPVMGFHTFWLIKGLTFSRKVGLLINFNLCLTNKHTRKEKEKRKNPKFIII